jgi:hypothetical protein
MKKIYEKGKVAIWEVRELHGTDYYVYGYYNSGDPYVCPSLGMAKEIAASA